MKTFEKLEQFKNQGKNLETLVGQHRDKVNEAGEHLENLRAQLRALVADGLRTSKDISADKDKLLGEISQAETAYEMAQLEYQEALKFADEKRRETGITAADVLRAYVHEYVPSVWESEVKPVLGRMTEARANYLNSILDLREKEREYLPLVSEIRDMASTTRVDGAMMSPVNPVDYRRSEVPYISGRDLAMIDRNELPPGVERKRTGE